MDRLDILAGTGKMLVLQNSSQSSKVLHILELAAEFLVIVHTHYNSASQVNNNKKHTHTNKYNNNRKTWINNQTNIDKAF